MKTQLVGIEQSPDLMVTGSRVVNVFPLDNSGYVVESHRDVYACIYVGISITNFEAYDVTFQH